MINIEALQKAAETWCKKVESEKSPQAVQVEVAVNALREFAEAIASPGNIAFYTEHRNSCVVYTQQMEVKLNLLRDQPEAGQAVDRISASLATIRHALQMESDAKKMLRRSPARPARAVSPVLKNGAVRKSCGQNSCTIITLTAAVAAFVFAVWFNRSIFS